jgi:uncharacterized caspase-like protein
MHGLNSPPRSRLIRISLFAITALISTASIATYAPKTAVSPIALPLPPATGQPDHRETPAGSRPSREAKSYRTAEQTSSARKVALVIANARYPDDKKSLTSPINDARALADELQRDGFEVAVAVDLTKQRMRAAVDSFKARIGPGMVALLFFSGYGMQTQRQSYLIPVDAQIWAESEVKRDGISTDWILSEMDAAGAAVKIVIIDAARRNPFEPRFRSHYGGLAVLNAAAGTLAIYSAPPDHVADESSGRNSLFVTELLEEMRSPATSAENIFNRTRVKVSAASRKERVPWVSSSLTDNFYFTGAQVSARPEAAKMETKTRLAKSAQEFTKRGRGYARRDD